MDKRKTAQGQVSAIVFARTRSRPPDGAADQAHLVAQLRICHEVATQLGAQIAQEFRAVGGTADAVVRAAVEQMLVVAAVERVSYVVVIAIDRLARRNDELSRIYHRLADADTRLVIAGPNDEAVFFDEVSLWPLGRVN